MKDFTRICIVLLICLSIRAYAGFNIVGYYPTWATGYPNSITNFDVSKITHLNIAFANPNTAGVLHPDKGTEADLAVIVNHVHAKGKKVLLSIAGGSAVASIYKNLLSNNQTQFVNNILSYVQTNNLDGIDIDMEGGMLNGTTITAVQYESFVMELKAALASQNKLLTAAVAKWFGAYISIAAARSFDFINSMSYDATGPWAPNNPGQHSPYSLAVNDYKYWKNTKQVDSTKINIGVPFYGYGFGIYANNGVSYCSIVFGFPGSENLDQVGNNNTDAIYYNGIPTIRAKTAFARQHAGGIMIWHMAMDCTDSTSLLSTIYNEYTNPSLVPEWSTEEDWFSCSPNPANESINIQFKSAGTEVKINLSLISMQGQLIKSGQPETVNSSVLWPLNEVAAGIYLLKIESGPKQSYYKIVKL